jgi:very-short-patch-repair endonuclease
MYGRGGYNHRRYSKRSDPAKYEQAKTMRNNPTPAEAKMYEIIYSEVFPKYPQHVFYRQSVKFGYILDFYCPTLRLGIEVDGDIHADRENYDRYRDTVLGRKNIQVFRFTNYDVLYNSTNVISRLCQIVKQKNDRGGFIPIDTDENAVGTTLQKRGACFIATAAYGTPMAKEINTLRRFRDKKMEPHIIGRDLIYLYYTLSPPLAKVITQSKSLRAFVRTILKPIISSLDRSKSV